MGTLGCHGQDVGNARWLRLLGGEQELRNYLVGQAHVRVLGEPEEVHPWNQDGVRWHQEGEGACRPHFLHGEASLKAKAVKAKAVKAKLPCDTPVVVASCIDLIAFKAYQGCGALAFREMSAFR